MISILTSFVLMGASSSYGTTSQITQLVEPTTEICSVNENDGCLLQQVAFGFCIYSCPDGPRSEVCTDAP
mgnify:CR=1 FL=1